MDGELQPKCGLMVSLILMNVAAIAFFFFATPTRETPAQNQSMRITTNNSENVPMLRAGITEKVMAGDAENRMVYNDENAVLAIAPDQKEVGKGFVSQKKISTAGMKDPRLPLDEAQIVGPQHSQNLPEKNCMNIINCISNTPKRVSTAGENAQRHTEPPLAVALKKFIGETSSGVRIFFDGLKNGYTKRRVRESIASNSSPERVSNINCEPLTQVPKVNPPTDTKITEPPQTSSETTPISVWGSMESGSTSNQDVISTELVMDILSSTQKRTNDLIYVFSKKVIPAIERMNERVADAVRLEKNLDSYTSALIGVINSLVCSKNDTDKNVKHKYSKSGTNVVRKLKHTKAFLSDLSLMRDSRIRDNVGTFSKGEHGSPNTRPVFKTLAARCWHTRNERMKRKNKKRSRRSEELLMPEDDEVHVPSHQLEVKSHQSHQGNLGQMDEIRDDAPVEVNYEFKADPENENINPIKNPTDGIVAEEEILPTAEQRIIGIEDVLALTFKLDQSRDRRINSDLDVQPFLSPLNCDVSMSSGMVCRSFVSEPTGLVNDLPNQWVNECNDGDLNTEQAESPENTSFSKSELHKVSTAHGSKPVDFLGSDFSVAYDSRIQGYNSCVAPNEYSCVAHSPKEGGTQLVASSETIATASKGLTQQPGESNQPVSFSAEAELVHVFQKLNRQEMDIALDFVCLLVLRVLEAWTWPQSSSRLSRISASSEYYSSSVETSHICELKTAICCSPRVAVLGPKAVFGSISKDFKLRARSTLYRISMDLNQSTAGILRVLLQSVVAPTEVEIGERSLTEVKTKVVQNPPLKVDEVEGCTDPINAANESAVEDNSETIAMDEDSAASLFSKSNKSINASKESSASTFYTSKPELSDETFYECVSTMPAGICCGTLDVEVQANNRIFLEKILEEGVTVHQSKNDAEFKPAAATEPHCRSLSLQFWDSDSEELRSAKDSSTFEDFSASDNSSYDFAAGTEYDGAYCCSSVDVPTVECKSGSKPKKKKWTAKFFKTFLKKKSKSSSSASIPLSKKASKSQSDSVLKPSDNTDQASY